MKLAQLSGIGTIAFVAMVGTASAAPFIGSGTTITPSDCPGCTITVTGDTDSTVAPTLPFGLVNLGTSASAGVVQTSTLLPGAGNGLTAAGITSITFASGGSTSPASGLYAGSSANLFTTPFTGQTTAPFTNYLVAGDNSGSVTINYGGAQNAFDLLWGTVDANNNENLLSLTINAGAASISGADIAAIMEAAVPPVTFSTGIFNVGVQITGLSNFTTITASDQTTANPAFEFVPGIVPAPPIGHGLAAVLAVCGGLFGFKLWERSKRRPPLDTVVSHAAA